MTKKKSFKTFFHKMAWKSGRNSDELLKSNTKRYKKYLK